LEEANRDLHNTNIEVKKEAAMIMQMKGEEKLLNSAFKDKMLSDPRYRKIVEKQKED